VVTGVLSSLLAAVIFAVGAFFWRYRKNRRLLRPALLIGKKVRVSFSVILRVKDDDCFVLFRASSRPSYGPPGGVFKYYPAAQNELDNLEYQDEVRPKIVGERRRLDLRGFIPGRSTAGFRRWFNTGVNRESATEALRRELAEEVAEVGHAELAANVGTLAFTYVRAVEEGPRREHGSGYLNLRRFEIYDLDTANESSLQFQRALVQLAHDDNSPRIICVDTTDISHGRSGDNLISGHSAFLFGRKRFHDPLPTIR
jgi:SMODS-associated NUDIX domain